MLLVVTYLSVFLAISLILVPFAYLKALFFKFSLVVDGKDAKDMFQRLAYALVFMFTGPIFLVMACFVDTFYEIMHIYQKNLKKVILARKQENVRTETFKNLLSLCKEFLRRKTHAVYTKDFIKRFRQDMKINQMMQFLVFGQFTQSDTRKLQQELGLTDSQMMTHALSKLEQYNLIKKIMISCSYDLYGK